MTSNQLFLLFVLICGIALHTALGQMDVFHSVSTGNAEQGNQDQQNVVPDDDDDDDEDENDAISRVGDAESIEEFLSLLQHINGQPVTLDEIIDSNTDAEGKTLIGHEGRMAIPDNCSPRNTTVRIEMDEDTDSDTAYFPRCTKIERCGGCCSSPNLECVPSYTERVVLKVLKGRVPFPGAPHLEYTGFASKIEERHMTCRVNCKLNAESCGPKKNFSRRRCNCKCKTRLPCLPPTSWDPEDCSCKCPSVSECCSTPNCGMVWSHSTCECILSNDGRVVISANDAVNAGPTTEQTTTTTTTTTTSDATTVDPCASISCPPRLIKVRVGNVCNCRFSGGRRRGSNRRG